MSYRYTKLDDREGFDGAPRYEIDDVRGFTVCIVDEEDQARIFCAAQDMLEAAILAEDALSDLARSDDGTCSISALQSLRDAIAKAKG